MNPKYKSKEYKKLQAEWYKRLERDGFKDIEQDEDNLKDWTLTLWRSKWFDPIKNESKQEYYRLAGFFLHDYVFADSFEKKVWELHSNGVSIANIIAKLKVEGFSAYRDNVHGVIKKLAKIMVQRVREE